MYPYFFVFHVKFKFTFQIWHPQPGSLIAPPPSPGTGMEGFPPPPPLHAVCPQLPRNSSPGNRSWEGGIQLKVDPGAGEGGAQREGPPCPSTLQSLGRLLPPPRVPWRPDLRIGSTQSWLRVWDVLTLKNYCLCEMGILLFCEALAPPLGRWKLPGRGRGRGCGCVERGGEFPSRGG